MAAWARGHSPEEKEKKRKEKRQLVMTKKDWTSFVRHRFTYCLNIHDSRFLNPQFTRKRDGELRSPVGVLGVRFFFHPDFLADICAFCVPGACSQDFSQGGIRPEAQRLSRPGDNHEQL
ncbi:hypothetical protein STEG23_010997 [Scotinomys teguina]